MRDVVIKRVPQPYWIEAVRIDTVFIPAPGSHTIQEVIRKDTVFIPMPGADSVKTILPIERREYRDDDYYAVVEGYRPELVGMTVYPQTKYITDTKERIVTKRPQ